MPSRYRRSTRVLLQCGKCCSAPCLGIVQVLSMPDHLINVVQPGTGHSPVSWHGLVNDAEVPLPRPRDTAIRVKLSRRLAMPVRSHINAATGEVGSSRSELGT